MSDSTEKLIRYCVWTFDVCDWEVGECLFNKDSQLALFYPMKRQADGPTSMPFTGIQRSEDTLSAKQCECLICHYRQKRFVAHCHWMDLFFLLNDPYTSICNDEIQARNERSRRSTGSHVFTCRFGSRDDFAVWTNWRIWAVFFQRNFAICHSEVF